MIDYSELTEYGIDVSGIAYLIDKYRSRNIIISVTGEFSAGKSCFMNCLLNKKDFLPNTNKECTSVLVDITSGAPDEMVVTYLDGTQERKPYSRELSDSIIAYYPEKEHDILSVSIPAENFPFPESVHIFDTPGTNTVTKEHEMLTSYIVSKSDLVIYIFDKVIGSSDIRHINEIRRNSSDIIYVMTHADETDNKTGEKFTEEKLNTMMNRARQQIADGIGVDADSVQIFPFGSVDGFEDRKYADAVIETVNAYTVFQSDSRMKDNVLKQIASIIDSGIENMNSKLSMQKESNNSSTDEFMEKIKKFDKDKVAANNNFDRALREMNSRLDSEKENCRLYFTDSLKKAVNQIADKIKLGNIGSEEIEELVNAAFEKIGKSTKEKIEKCLSSIMNESFSESADIVNSLYNEFSINSNVTITVPEISQIHDSYLESEIKRASDEKKQKDEQYEQNNTEIEELEKKKKEFDKEISEQTSALSEKKNELAELGEYVPQYDEYVKEGSEESGKRIGKVIGEVVDLAFLFIPVGGVAEAGSTAAKASSAAVKAGKAAKKAQEAAKAIDKTKDMLTVAKYVKNGLQKANDVKNKVSDFDAQNGGGFSDILDMLSVSYWFEKAGGKIAGKINPTVTEQVENEDNKTEYFSKRTEIESKKTELEEKCKALTAQMEKADNFDELQKTKRQLEICRNDLASREKMYKDLLNESNEKSKKEQETISYTNQIFDSLEEQKSTGLKMLEKIFEGAKDNISSLLKNKFNSLVEELDGNISEIKDNISNLDAVIKKQEADIAVVQSYKDKIEDMLA